MAPSPGRSLTDVFRSTTSGQVVPERDHVLIGMERHDIGRPHDAGYPIRGIVRDDLLYLHNFEPSRWPASNPETGYLNVDAGPTKTFILDAHRADAADRAWALCFGKRPGDELYDLKQDPIACTTRRRRQATSDAREIREEHSPNFANKAIRGWKGWTCSMPSPLESGASRLLRTFHGGRKLKARTISNRTRSIEAGRTLRRVAPVIQYSGRLWRVRCHLPYGPQCTRPASLNRLEVDSETLLVRSDARRVAGRRVA
jgi:hypothetical protein